MIEHDLMNYGILGLWTATLLAERYKFQKEMSRVLKDNTDAIKCLKNKLK